MTTTIDTVQEAQRRLNTAAGTIAQLRRENRFLRRKLAHNGRYGRVLRRAHDDAQTLLMWRWAGFYPSRSFCYEQGLSERRWSWARGLLRAARLWDNNDLPEGVPLEQAQRQLRATYERIQASDDERLESLRARMPRKFRYTGK